MLFKVEYLIANGANLNLVASKRDVAKGAKLTPRELALEIQFEPMSVFDGAPEPAPETSPKVTPSPASKVTPPPANKATPSPAAAQGPSPAPSKVPAATEGGEKKIAITEAELEAMIQARVESQVASQVEKALKIMKMNDESKKKAETPPKEEKSSEDREVEAAMERMRADEAKEKAAKQ